jgi:LPPG:FO 2-phospho-L-lactate transferase
MGENRAVDVVLLTGGLGGARLAPALRAALGPGRLTVIANVGDDLDWMGLRVCPDVDSVLYALAGVWDGERGWGRREETFAVRDALGNGQWFNVGDRDLATHIRRTAMLRAGRTLTAATEAVAAGLGVDGVRVLPACDEPAQTHVVTADGRRLHFQEWYVREHAEPEIAAVDHARAPAAPSALAALAAADHVILGPSSPVASIAPILALDGMRAAVAAVPRRTAVSPVVAAVEPADAGARHHARARGRLLAAQGCSHEPAAIAALYADLVERFVVDRADAAAVEGAVLSELLDPAELALTLTARGSTSPPDRTPGSRPRSP